MTLVAPLPAGTWHLIGDGLVIEPVDVRFDVIWRAAGASAGPSDVVVATWQHHFDPGGDVNSAVAFEADAPGIAAKAKDGDLLVLRFTGMNATKTMSYVPNGDGANTHGRIPSLDLPKP